MLTIVMAAMLAVGPRVRTADAVIGKALEDGLRRSETIRRLVDDLNASDLIVYLSRGDCPRPAAACLMMGPRGPGARYVRINFRLPDGPGVPRAWYRDDLLTMIAHELQHAAEVAGWPDVVDGKTLLAAYKRAGHHPTGAHVDTKAAIASGDITRVELKSRR